MTKTVSLDQDLLATLTDEERAAIEESSDEEIASLKAVGTEKDPVHNKADASLAEDDQDDKDEEGEGDATDAESAVDAVAAAVEDPALAAEAAAAEAAPAQAAAEPAPTGFRYELPADYEERKAAVRTANAAALEKYDAGEFTKEELLAEQDRIAEERRELDGMQTKADIAQQMRQQSNEDRRLAAVNRLFDDAAKPEAGAVDYRKDAGKMRDLDTFVKALAADEANAEKPMQWFLDEAHRRVKVLHGISETATPTPTPKPKTPAEIKAAAVAARKPDLTGGAADLSQVPGGQGDSDVGGEFEDVMSLDGDAFEAAIARMAKTQPERWARFQAQQQ